MAASFTARLADMDKAITEMEVALAVIKPEFRAAMAATAPSSVPTSTKPTSSSSRKEDKKLRKERKDRERVERRARRQEAKAAELARMGKGSKKPPTPSRHASDPAIAGLPPSFDLPSPGTAPLAIHSGSGDLLSPASAAVGTGRDRSSTISSTSGKHKGLRGIFRKTSSSGGQTSPPLPNSLSVAVHLPSPSPFGPGGVPPPGHLSVPSSPADPASPSASSFLRHSHISLPMSGPPPPSPALPSFHQALSSRHRSSPGVLLLDLYPAVEQLDHSLNNLRAMHSALLEDSRRSNPPLLSDLERYRLSTIGREASDVGTLRGNAEHFPDADEDQVRAMRTHQRAPSTSSRLSSVLSIWYDAEVMPELGEAAEDHATSHAEVGSPGEESSSDSDDEGDFADVASVMLGHSTPRSSVYERSNSVSTTSTLTASSTALSSVSAGDTTRHSFATARPEDSLPAAPASSTTTADIEIPIVQWRTKLPVPMPKDEGSLISVLRKSVGKDMSQISMPVTFNEAISLLQRAAEDIEYSNLLTLAAHSLDSTERLAHIAAFAVSSYAGSRYRSSRKPFNPMLGETFELVRDGVSFVAEKVSHHPPVIASHADGPGWSLGQTSSAKNKLAGMSLEITPIGATNVTLERTGERFTWTKPSSYIRNLVAGTKYVETIGTMEVVNLTNNDVCQLTFKEGGWGGSGRNVVSGVITSAAGKKVAWIDGKWDSKLGVKYGPYDPASLLWQTKPWPADAEKYYGWTYFTMALNQLDPSFEHLLPSSDSRFNPAQRALENGDLDRAESAKLELETRQRARNRAREERGEAWTPRFFRRDSGGGYKYIGGYWEARRSGTFADLDLW